MKSTSVIVRWLPAAVMMAIIFAFSSIPSAAMPEFDWADFIVKKGGHMLGYAMLAVSIRYGLEGTDRRGIDGLNVFWPWLLAVIYAASDEFHQSFVPGRNPSPLDVGIDALGAAIGLGIVIWLKRKK